MEKKWFQKYYRRNFLDMHVPEWNDEFLSRLDPQEVLNTVKLSNGKVMTLFANSHTGLCYFPSKAGPSHKALGGKDLLGEFIDLFQKNGYYIIIYYCTIYVDWYWDTHPEARIVDSDGQSQKLIMNDRNKPRRFSTCCPNNPMYRDFVVAQLKEICENYRFDGMWPDMAFWPNVCYCDSCRKRYRDEVGGEIPRRIDWEDPVWVGFQRKRQEWLVEFSSLVTSTIKGIKPEVTVAHQSATFSKDWLQAPSVSLAQCSDWLSSDLYRDKYDLSYLCKMFYSLSENKPFEFVNCWYYPQIREHVVAKTEEELRCSVFAAFMNNGAMVFIDAIDPDGRLNKNNYYRAGKIFKELEKYEEYAGGEYCQDVAIYVSFDSFMDMDENGREVVPVRNKIDPRKGADNKSLHCNAAIGFARTLLEHHVPFGVITKKDLRELSRYQVVILPNMIMMDQDEVEGFQDYVREGGCLYAGKDTSLMTKEGNRLPDFQLSEMLRVSYQGETREITTYVSPKESVSDLFLPFSSEYPVTLYGPQTLVSAKAGAEVLATLTLPYSDPKGSLYASILSDPPGIGTSYPSIVFNRYGKGKTLYCAGSFEIWEHQTQMAILANLVKMLPEKPLHFETDAPAPVEITKFDQVENKRFLLNLLNYQKDLPNIPIYNIRMKMWMNGRKAESVCQVPGNERIPFTELEGSIEFNIPRLDTYVMIAINYG